MGNQRLDFQLPACHEVNNGLEITPFCPADIADGVVLSVLFVIRVVAAGSVGAGVDEGNLFFVVDLAGEVKTHCARGYNFRAVTGNGTCQFNGVVRRGIRADDNRVKSAVGREGLSGGFGLGARYSLNVEGRGELDPLRVNVNAENVASSGIGNLNRQ